MKQRTEEMKCVNCGKRVDKSSYRCRRCDLKRRKIITSMSFYDKFFSRIRVKKGCWEWTGNKYVGGYGQYSSGYRKYQAHRLMWTCQNGEIPSGAVVMHNCDNKLCVRPSHLILGSQKENMRDMIKKKRDRFYFKLNPPHGERNSNSKLSENDVIEIRRTFASGSISREAICRKYGIKNSNVSNIVNRASWKHI